MRWFGGRTSGGRTGVFRRMDRAMAPAKVISYRALWRGLRRGLREHPASHARVRPKSVLRPAIAGKLLRSVPSPAWNALVRRCDRLYRGAPRQSDERGRQGCATRRPFGVDRLAYVSYPLAE